MTDTPDFSHLPAATARFSAVLARPRVVAAGCIIVLAALGWMAIAWLVAEMGAAGASGWWAPLAAICRASIGAQTPIAVVLLMWGAMVLAMMLPTAGPMILTYAEIAETAAKKDDRIVSPLTLAAGYGVVWLGFAVFASIAQIALTGAALMDGAMASASGLFSGAILIGAGVYQFTPLKHACLTQCQRPFPFFFARWQTTPKGVFRLGLTQGLYCLGCCWAMMLVMFAAGTMNVIWMAALGIVMTIEKFGSGRLFSHVIGVGLMLGGLAFLVTSFAAHWPAGAG